MGLSEIVTATAAPRPLAESFADPSTYQEGASDEINVGVRRPRIIAEAPLHAPYRRRRIWYERIARRKSIFRNPGQYTSTKYSSAYASCHSRKFEIRSSPLVRSTRSGSGRSAVYSRF